MIEYYKDRAGKDRWRAVDDHNGQTVGTGHQGYSSKQKMEQGMEATYRELRKWKKTRKRRRFSDDGAVRPVAGVVLVAAAVLALVVAAVPVGSADLTIPVTTVVRGAPGDVIEAGSVPSGPLAGQVCDVSLTGANNHSTHPDNDLIVSSVGVLTFFDIEAESDSSSGSTGRLELGEEVTVSLRLGADGVSSGGFSVAFDCQPPTTTVPPTTTPSTTTSLPPTPPEPPTVTVPNYPG